ncbi:MAG: hypothetical protein IJV36_04965 [Prevotella sp.]|nr:hypothetical protein [Prevotella sp.]
MWSAEGETRVDLPFGSSKAQADCYTLSGQKTDSIPTGIYIINGKKMAVR